MIESYKNNRVKIGRILLAAFPTSRAEIKRLIKYPEATRINISSQTSNLSISAQVADSQTNQELSQILNTEVSLQSRNIDVSDKSARINIQGVQSGIFSADVGYSVSYSDGRTISRQMLKGFSGDGTGVSAPVFLSEELPAPEGWPKI